GGGDRGRGAAGRAAAARAGGRGVGPPPRRRQAQANSPCHDEGPRRRSTAPSGPPTLAALAFPLPQSRGHAKERNVSRWFRKGNQDKGLRSHLECKVPRNRFAKVRKSLTWQIAYPAG